MFLQSSKPEHYMDIIPLPKLVSRGKHRAGLLLQALVSRLRWEVSKQKRGTFQKISINK